MKDRGITPMHVRWAYRLFPDQQPRIESDLEQIVRQNKRYA
ncbi:MAG TPA: hypothetical protein VFZ16_15195 [Hyphomicrobiaceae bacterium]|nr:hypothetical protein [Hyphomicrobiaceae bacterium]